MVFQHSAAVRFDFTECDGAHASALKAQREPADAGEQIKHVHIV